MPPSRHSSSSHHSSSHHSSSHHSSSSHFSSGSSRSFSSSSSHSSSSYRSSSYGRSSGNSIYSVPSQFTRTRSNQPRGYRAGTYGPAPKEFHCKNHDYIYYASSWTDSSTGQFYKKGYYDETGKQYDDVLISDGPQKESKFLCPYCNTVIRTAWTQGAKPTCPNCSAQMDEAMSDELVKPVVFSLPHSSPSRGSSSGKIKPLIIAVLVLFGIISEFGGYEPEVSKSPSSYTTQSSTYYVEEIGRYCAWDSASENYYDAITDCYFWYNDQVDPPTWQYWYESISSDFGDYGWMEFDETEGQWYIEIDDEDWIVLPDTYSTSDLWYIHE